MKPFNGKLLIQKIEQTNKTSGGILLTETSQSPFIEAIIEEVSDSILSPMTKQEVNMPIDLDKGVKIIILRNSGAKIDINGKELFLIDVSEVIGIK